MPELLPIMSSISYHTKTNFILESRKGPVQRRSINDIYFPWKRHNIHLKKWMTSIKFHYKNVSPSLPKIGIGEIPSIPLIFVRCFQHHHHRIYIQFETITIYWSDISFALSTGCVTFFINEFNLIRRFQLLNSNLHELRILGRLVYILFFDGNVETCKCKQMFVAHSQCILVFLIFFNWKKIDWGIFHVKIIWNN